ncbi:alpha-L-rhamnosidase [Lactobacillus colini]|uniref:alpha-L-rhamnosidase n=1 Tax=Lactobacillus colini TaxID=1819254 RepID=A0ABS4MES7_9LACO|nr:family 78 glycoside hydrolase catalytic domain [Lactobacillus colini]MBP2058191.1 alpha-L-rhamnosidase [Lactobacillus colini]
MTELFRGSWLTRRHIDYGANDRNYYEENPSIIYEKQFLISSVKRTKIRICSLGYYIVKINGKLVTTDVLNNDWTYYSKRKYYEEYDISELIHIGVNTVTVQLGNGMYNPAPLLFFGKHNFRENLAIGEPKFVLDIIEDNGERLCVSDATWQAHASEIKFNNVYLGESIDPNYAGKKVAFKHIKVSINDNKTFMRSFIPKIKKFGPISAKVIKNWKNNYLFVDFGQVTSGFIHLKINPKVDATIELKYCESKDENDKLDFSASYAGGIGVYEEVKGGPGAPDKAEEIDHLELSSGHYEYENKFTYHSFRYVIISGISIEEIELIEAIPVHTDLKQIGNVKTGNRFFNELFDAGINTRLNNVHAIFEDCARERLQYGGDIVALAMSMLYSFDLSQFNKKTIYDFILGQTEKGGIPETAPYIGIETQGTAPTEGPLLWQFVLPYLIYKTYQFYGDKELVLDTYQYVEKQYEYFKTWKLEDLAQHCIGDHGSPIITGVFYSTPDKAFVGYATILLFNEMNQRIAEILGKNTASLKKDNQIIRQEIIKLYQNNDGSFGEKTESSYAFALALNLGSQKVLLKQLLTLIDKNNGVWSSGIFGQSILYSKLHELGYDDYVYNWLTNETNISFKYMLKRGNKILEEQFVHHPADSANHAMFSSYIKWYFEAIGGIKLLEETAGLNKIELSPYFNSELGNTEISINTIHGLIEVKTIYSKKCIKYQVSLPKNVDYQISDELKDFDLNESEVDERRIMTFIKIKK